MDPFSKKEWYDIKAPNVFPNRQVGKTLSTKTIGAKMARDSLIHRVVEVSLGDLKPNGEDDAFRKFKLKVQEVSGNSLLTNFYGMDLSTDKIRSLVRKWHSTIESFTDVKTTDGFTFRLFCIGFTKRRPNQSSTRKACYAQSAQGRTIRKKMIEIMEREAGSVDSNELVAKLMTEIIGKDIEKATQGIYPLQNVHIRKVKLLRAPKTDISRLMELHGGAPAAPADAGKKVEREEENKE